MSEPWVAGGCLCGAVRFRVELPSLFCGHCHCSLCRRNHGAAYVTWFAVPRERLAIEEGSEALTRYASTPHGSRSFCRHCGTSLFCEVDAHPDQVDVPLAVMDGPIDREPQVHIYFSDRASWVHAKDGLPRLGGASGMEPWTEDEPAGTGRFPADPDPIASGR